MDLESMDNIQRLEDELSVLQQELVQARSNVQSWTDANASLSRNAAEARAKNQSSGRGLVGAFLGSKFRGAMRRDAAASNAAIAREVASKRQQIAAGKLQAQQHVRDIQERISGVKSRIRGSKAAHRASVNAAASNKAVQSGRRREGKASVDLLLKLKEAHQLGLLTDAEFEEKRIKLVNSI